MQTIVAEIDYNRMAAQAAGLSINLALSRVNWRDLETEEVCI